MKLIDIKLTNFKKLSNSPQPTISFKEDITVLVGANNAGKTSILKSIQKLFKTEEVNPVKDLNYLIEDGNLVIDATIKLTQEQWKSYLRLSLGSLPHIPLDSINIDDLAKKMVDSQITLKHTIPYIKRKQSNYFITADLPETAYDRSNFEGNPRSVIQNALNQFAHSDTYNVYHTPLYLDSKGEIQEQEMFIPLSQIKNQRGNGNKVNIRGLLYSLKKEEPKQFEEFKKRLLEIFTELQDIDVRNNEELGQFELVLSEKLKKNGDSQLVDYDIKNVGQGMQTLVLMLSNILLLKPSIVLMDEPEVHMHPSLIKEFVKYIKQLSTDTQFIITTHSVVLMNEVGLDKLFSLKYEAEQKGVIATPVEDRNKLLDTVNSLGYNVDSLTYTLKPKVFVFTEGPSDKDLILAFASKKGLTHDINTFTIGFISMGGKGNRYKLADLIDKMNKEFIDSPLLMILDRDETAPEQVEDIKRKFFSKNPKRLHYLSKRQIENYLLDGKAIAKYVDARIENDDVKQKWKAINIFNKFLELAELQKEDLLNNYLSEIFIGDSLINTENIRQIIKSLGAKPLNESVREFSGELSKLISLRTFDLGQKTTSAIAEFEEKWKVPENELEMVDGRELLTAFRRWTEENFKISFSNTDIINEMENIPTELDLLIEQLRNPEELKIKQIRR
jgi:predicted ATP-dependent endonuclease of OLD family